MSATSRRVAIVSSNGLRATYGGWDQLVNNLVDRKAEELSYVVFNPRDTPVPPDVPAGVVVRQLPLHASGFQGLIFDFWSVLLCFRRVDAVLLLGVQAIPLLGLLKLVWPVTIVANVGGIEWERPQFGMLSKLFLKLCFWLSLRCAKTVVLDNPHHGVFLPARYRARVEIIPYGGTIDTSLGPDDGMRAKYPFLREPYYLSVSRSVADNQLEELCAAFAGTRHRLVLISNLSKSEYGRAVQAKYAECANITLIDGLYLKPELDLIRRQCAAYVHTHALCGTAPSLVEMVVARRPILSTDAPQNRFTLGGSGYFYSDFGALIALLDGGADLDAYIPPDHVARSYRWDDIVRRYETTYSV